MNNTSLVGRLVRDIELRSNNSATVARFTLAVDRKFKQEGQATADFISCIAFGKTAEFIDKYFSKGQRLGLNGRIQTGSYKDKNGNTVYTTDVVAESVEFVESAGNGQTKHAEVKPSDNSNIMDEGFMQVADDLSDEGLPFE